MAMPDYAQKYLREFVNKEDSDSLWQYVRQLLLSWEGDGFKGEWEARIVYTDFVTACQIRHYCRKFRLPTRKGSRIFTTQDRDPQLYRHIVCDGGAEGVSWQKREVDQLRNLYIYFN